MDFTTSSTASATVRIASREVIIATNHMALIGLCGILTLVFVLYSAVPNASSKQITPDLSYCREINDPTSGAEIVLPPGDYRGPCQITRGGKPGFPLVIRALDMKLKPRIQYDGQNGIVFGIYADHITIRGLRFGPTLGEVDAVRIFSGDHVTVEECVFDQIGGISVVANHGSIKGAVVRQNVIQESRSTAIYFGCHDGRSCTDSDVMIVNNFISGVTAAPSQIGYGIQFKLNSTGVIRDNVILNTKGPGIMIYGTADAVKTQIIERNFVMGSQQSSGIVIGGGPALYETISSR